MKSIESGYYRHFKGGDYQVLTVALHTERPEKLVIYQSLQDQNIYARPLTMFVEEVEYQGKKVPRFSKL